MHSYNVFGLSLASAIPITALAPGDPQATPDITLKKGPVSGTVDQGYFDAVPNSVLVVPQPGLKFLAEGGDRITLDDDGSAHPGEIELYLLGTVLSAIAWQRGLYVLHANAIDMGDHAIAIAGDAGAGKSTTAAAFYKAGFPILTDDTCPLDWKAEGGPFVQPSYCRIKLCDDAASQFNHPSWTLDDIFPSYHKKNLMIDRRGQQPKPLRAIYVLEVGDESAPLGMTVLNGREKFMTLQRLALRIELLRGLALLPLHFYAASAMSTQVIVKKITRPRDVWLVDDIRQLVQNDWQAAVPAATLHVGGS